jgi:hypothetical protein
MIREKFEMENTAKCNLGMSLLRIPLSLVHVLLLVLFMLHGCLAIGSQGMAASALPFDATRHGMFAPEHSCELSQPDRNQSVKSMAQREIRRPGPLRESGPCSGQSVHREGLSVRPLQSMSQIKLASRGETLRHAPDCAELTLPERAGQSSPIIPSLFQQILMLALNNPHTSFQRTRRMPAFTRKRDAPHSRAASMNIRKHTNTHTYTCTHTYENVRMSVMMMKTQMHPQTTNNKKCGTNKYQAHHTHTTAPAWTVHAYTCMCMMNKTRACCSRATSSWEGCTCRVTPPRCIRRLGGGNSAGK